MSNAPLLCRKVTKLSGLLIAQGDDFIATVSIVVVSVDVGVYDVITRVRIESAGTSWVLHEPCTA